MGDVVIFGASRGLGAALATGVPAAGERTWCIARTRPACLDLDDGVKREWIEHDLSDPDSMAAIAARLAGIDINLFVYNAGIWESLGFEKADLAELRAIVDVNLTSLLLAARMLLPNVRRSANARVVLISSTCGLDNEGTTSVAYAATKFAMRGAGQALRELLRPDGIAVTVISPGSMATDLTLADGADAALAKHAGKRIPVGDVVEIVRLIRRLSPAACVKDLVLPALADDDM